MDKIELEIIGLSYSQTQTGAYALVLGEKGGAKRRLPIIIGGFEAQAIAIELESMTPSRPLTHDLFKSFADIYAITIKEIIIYNLIEGIFYAKLISEKEVLKLLAEKPKNLEIVLTGRGATKKIIQAADLVTEMKLIKHPYYKNIPARKGIEY